MRENALTAAVAASDKPSLVTDPGFRAGIFGPASGWPVCVRGQNLGSVSDFDSFDDCDGMLTEIRPSRMEKTRPAGAEEQDWTEVHGVNGKMEEGDV